MSMEKEIVEFSSGIIEAAILKDALSYFKADLTENRLVPPVKELIDGQWVDYMDKLGDNLLNYDEIIRVSAEAYLDPKYRESYIENLCSSNLISRFENGISTPEYTCRIHSSHFGWHYRKYLSCLSIDEENGHIMVLNIAYDVTKQIEAEKDMELKLNHTRLRAEILGLMLQDYLDQDAFIYEILQRVLDSSEADQVVYRADGDRKYVVNSKEMEELGEIPEDYCAMCPHSDIHSAVYKDGYTVMSDCKDSSQGITIYEKCPVKSAMSRLLYHDGKAYGYISMHYIREHHEFSEYSRETFRQLAEFIQNVYSQYAMKEEHGRALAAISTMTEDFDYIAAVNEKERTVSRLRYTDKFIRVKNTIDEALPGYERLDRFFKLVVHPDDMQMFREKSDLRVCIAELEKNPNYKFEFRTLYDGKEEYYRIKFAYMPDNHDIVIIGLLNIDEQVRREMETAAMKEKAEKEAVLLKSLEQEREFRNVLVDSTNGFLKANLSKNEIEGVITDVSTTGERIEMEAMDIYGSTGYDEFEKWWAENKLLSNPDEFLAKSSCAYLLSRFEAGESKVEVLCTSEDEKGDPKICRQDYYMYRDGLTGDVRAFCIVWDITEEVESRKRLEQELSVINGLASDCVSLYTADLDNNTYKVYSITDAVDDIKSVVEGYRNLPKALRDYADGYVFEDDREKVYYYSNLDNMRAALRNTRSQKITVRRNINGQWVWIEMNMIKVEPVDQPAHNVILSFTNRTEQVKEELEIRKQLEDARSMAESANTAKTNFLFNMSHDIRTPMNAITGFTNMAIKHIDNKEKVIDCLDKTQKAGTMLLSLINSVLEVSRIESGNAGIEEQPGDVFLSFANISTTMNELAATKDIRLTFSFGAVKDRFVYADFSRCMRIFVNIITNAIKYTREGGFVDVRCEQVGESKDGVGTYRYTITDNGIGMSEEFQEHIYDQFAREKTSTVSGIQGTGLGMSVVKSFVDLLGGEISVKSRLGEGTTFTILLPFRLQEEARYTDPKTGEVVRSNRDAEAVVQEVSFVGKNVLLVEDNEMNSEIATEILEEEGMVVECADDGTTALQMLKERGIEFFDFILMDIQMPVMNGYEATREIRRLYPDVHIPIVAVSANAFEEDRQKSLEAGMDDHVAKPINVSLLKETLARYL